MKTTSEASCLALRISPGPDALIAVSGELDLASVPAFEAALQALDLQSVRRALLDLERLTFMDAAGLHAVLGLHAACLRGSTSLTIIPGPWQVQRIFEITGADRLLQFSRR